MKKILFLVIDGLADDPIPQLNGQTPLEAANTPNFDFLAKNGVCGVVIPWTKKGELPTSEDCHLALFGYSPPTSNPGRGVLEAIGIDEKLTGNEVCLRGNFASVDENLFILDRRAERIENTSSLILALNKISSRIKVKRSFGHRIVLIIKGKDLGEKITSNDPKKVGEKVLPIIGKDKKSQKTAQILREFLEKAHIVLRNHPLNKKRVREGRLPANYLLLRGAGRLKKVKSFYQKYKLKAGVIAGGILYKGIGKFLGMEEIPVKGATGKKDTNLKGKILKAKQSLSRFDFIFLHIKAPDTFGEDGDFQGKKEFLEKIDSHLPPLFDLKNTLLVITGDHPTSCLKKSHSLGTNPLLIFGDGKDNVEKFSERECEKGALGKILQINLLKKVLKLASRVA